MRTGTVLGLVSVLFGLLWLLVHPPLPQLPGGDVFTSLAVARHLTGGDGLVNDTVYPLFTAYEWGQTIPQPLIHRPPGLAVLLLPAWWGAGGDPAMAERLVRPVMVVIVAGIGLVGLLGLRRQQHLAAGGAWLLVLLISPLLALAVEWGWSEVPAGLMLLVLWRFLRNRRPADFGRPRTVAFALLSATLAMIRSDVLWIPVLWWFCAIVSDPRPRRRQSLAATLIAGVVGTIAIAPWYGHVTRHAGAPLANPLVEAVQLDLTEDWWQYPHLRSRTPIPLWENLRANPGPALHKIAVGIKAYLRDLGLWLPWLFWVVVITLWIHRSARRLRDAAPPGRALGPPGFLVLTTGLMFVQYGLFSHEYRHLLPLLPVIAWEGVILVDEYLRRALHGPWRRGLVLAAGTWLALQLTPPGLGDEQGNVSLAIATSDEVARTVDRSRDLPDGPIFSDSAIVPWRLGRPYVWNPYTPAIEQQIRDVVPEMADAPWVRLEPAPPTQ